MIFYSQFAGYNSQFLVRRMTAQSIPASSYTKVQFNSKVYDNKTEYDAVTNFRFVAKEAGFYHFGAIVGITSGVDTETVVGFLKRNGTDSFGHDRKILGGAGTPYVKPAGDIDLEKDDYVEVEVYHNMGAGKDTSTSYSCCFYGHRIA